MVCLTVGLSGRRVFPRACTAEVAASPQNPHSSANQLVRSKPLLGGSSHYKIASVNRHGSPEYQRRFIRTQPHHSLCYLFWLPKPPNGLVKKHTFLRFRSASCSRDMISHYHRQVNPVYKEASPVDVGVGAT
jgi:hypothetical protein